MELGLSEGIKSLSFKFQGPRQKGWNGLKIYYSQVEPMCVGPARSACGAIMISFRNNPHMCPD